jgi:hypothetical protein
LKYFDSPARKDPLFYLAIFLYSCAFVAIISGVNHPAQVVEASGATHPLPGNWFFALIGPPLVATGLLTLALRVRATHRRNTPQRVLNMPVDSSNDSRKTQLDLPPSTEPSESALSRTSAVEMRDPGAERTIALRVRRAGGRNIIATTLICSSAALSILGSFFPAWSSIPSSSWWQDFALIWFAEALLIAIAGIASIRSLNVAVAILIPAVTAKIISLGQFYVPHSGFNGHLNNVFLLDATGFFLAVAGLVVALIPTRDSWALTREGLVVAAVYFLLAVIWSIGVAMPWDQVTFRALNGTSWTVAGKPVYIRVSQCCWVTDPSYTSGQQIVYWFQLILFPLVVLLTCLRTSRTVRAIGILSAGIVMASVAFSGLFGLGSVPSGVANVSENDALITGNIIAIAASVVILISASVLALWDKAKSESLPSP